MKIGEIWELKPSELKDLKKWSEEQLINPSDFSYLLSDIKILEFNEIDITCVEVNDSDEVFILEKQKFLKTYQKKWK